MAGGDFRAIQVQQLLGVTPQVALAALALHDAAGQVVATAALAVLIHAGRAGSAPSAVVVRQVVRRLRTALADGDSGAEIEAVREQGYRLAGPLFEPSSQTEIGGVCSFTLHKAPRGRGVRLQSLAPLPATYKWGAAQAWTVATVVAAAATGVGVEHIAAQTVTGQRRPAAITSARALAIYLAVSGGDASRKGLARAAGFDLGFIKDTVRGFTARREDDADEDAALEALEAQVLDRLQAAHARKASAVQRAQARAA